MISRRAQLVVGIVVGLLAILLTFGGILWAIDVLEPLAGRTVALLAAALVFAAAGVGWLVYEFRPNRL